MRVSEAIGMGGQLFTNPRALYDDIMRRPVLMLFLANIFAQAVSVGFAPVLSRIYSPVDFGVLGAFNAVVMICVPLTTLRYELAIPRAAADREAYRVLQLCMLTIAIMSLCFAGLALLAANLPMARLAPHLAQYWYIVPLGLASVALYDTLAMEASRRKHLTPLAGSKLTQAGLGVGGQIAFGLLGWGTLGLLVGFLLNQAAGVTRLFSALVLKHPARGPVTLSELRATALENKHFPLYTGWSAALDACARWALQLALSAFWDPFAGGYVFLADRIIGRPLLLLSTSLLPVYVSDVSRAMRTDPRTIPRIFNQSLRSQALVSAAWTVCVVALAPYVIEPLFGARWSDSVRYVQIMSIAIAPVSTMHSVAYTLQLAGRQRLESLIVVGRVSAIFAGLLGSWLAGFDALATLQVFAAVQLGFAGLRYIIYARVVSDMATAHAPMAPDAGLALPHDDGSD